MKLHSAPAIPAVLAAPAPFSAPLATHLCLPLALVLVANAWLAAGGGDMAFADLLYRLEGGRWALQDGWITQQLVHRGGRWLSILGAAGVLVATWRAWRVPAHPLRRPLRRPLLVLVVSLALSTGLVSLLKHLTAMDCPWDLARYGGDRAYFGLFQSRQGVPASGCFPAGHASAGYAWVALYFFALATRPRWRWIALAIGLGAGAVFGFAQQLRGAHFLSHDLWSLAVCWLVALGVFRLSRMPPRQRRAETPA